LILQAGAPKSCGAKCAERITIGKSGAVAQMDRASVS
jgi:hypothetical protein